MPPFDILELANQGEITDEKLKGVKPEDVVRGQIQLVQMVQEHVKQIETGLRTKEESMAEFQNRLSDLGRMLEAVKAERPVPREPSELQGEYAARKGGLFRKDAPQLPYEELISLSPENPIVRGADQDLLKDLHDAHDAMVFQNALNCIVEKAIDNPTGRITAFQKAAKSRDGKRYTDLVKHAGYLKANEIIHPASGGIVNPLTMSLTSGTVVDLVRINLNVANQFPEIPMQNWDQKIPANRGDGIGHRGGDATTDPPPKDAITSPFPPSDYVGSISFGTAQLVAEDVLAFLWWNDRAVSDSVIALVPYLRNMIAFMHARAIDRSCMSGDIQGRTAGAHMDDWASTMNTNDARTLWNGLRRISANYMTDNAGNMLDGEDVRLMLKTLGAYGLDKSQLRLWLNTGPAYDLLTDSDVAQAYQGLGVNTPTITGELGRIWGIPILPTEWIPTDLSDITGFSVNGGVKTAAVLARVDRFLLGVHAGVMIETTRVAPTLSTVIQATGRYDFVPVEAVDANGIFAAGSTVPVRVLFDLPA